MPAAVAVLVWRLVEIGLDVIHHLAPGDKRMAGTLMLVGVYLTLDW
jgi:hypothetical protein